VTSIDLDNFALSSTGGYVQTLHIARHVALVKHAYVNSGNIIHIKAFHSSKQLFTQLSNNKNR